MVGDYFMSRNESDFSLPGIIYISSEEFEECIQHFNFLPGGKIHGLSTSWRDFPYLCKLTFFGKKRVVIRENGDGIMPPIPQISEIEIAREGGDFALISINNLFQQALSREILPVRPAPPATAYSEIQNNNHHDKKEVLCSLKGKVRITLEIHLV